MATLSLRNIKKVYDNKVTAVDDFNLEIADNEFVVFVGPSGCGKSTTLRMVAGLEDISDGDLYIDDVRMNDVAPKDRDIAMVFQNYALYPHMTVFQNMAFALTRLIWKRRKTMNKFFMLGLTIPIHASIVPVYVTLSRMNMLNTYWALIIPYAAFSLAMAILVCVGFMNEIPRELDESACIDGCGVFGIFFRIIVPLMKPAVATVGIYTFLQCWNELMFANVFISNSALRTLPVGVQALSGQYTTEWGPIGAALVLATFPTLIVYIFLSKKIQESFIAGAVKG